MNADAMSEGESEISDVQYSSEGSMSSHSPSPGPSKPRSSRGSAGPLASQKARTKRRNLQEIMNANPGSEFPWDEVLFYVPGWLPPVIRQHILRRIQVSSVAFWAS